MQLARTFLAFVTAPIVVGFCYAIANATSGSDMVAFLPIVAVVASIALLHELFLGVPVALFLRHMKALRFRNIVFFATLIGAIPLPLVLAASSESEIGAFELAKASGLGAGLGLVGGVVWSLVAGVSPNNPVER